MLSSRVLGQWSILVASFSFSFIYSIHFIDSKYNGELQSNKNPKDYRFQIWKGLIIVLIHISSKEIKAHNSSCFEESF